MPPLLSITNKGIYGHVSGTQAGNRDPMVAIVSEDEWMVNVFFRSYIRY